MVWNKVKAFPLIREIRKKYGGISTANEKVLHVFELNKRRKLCAKKSEKTKQSQHEKKNSRKKGRREREREIDVLRIGNKLMNVARD